ncbi:YdeI/OmpD-associated family protein [Jatrophihabitans sp. YIM 134969]
MDRELPVVSFPDRAALRSWLTEHHADSAGVLVVVPQGGRPGLRFEDLLDEGLCFGWSESTRLPGDDECYLQRFTPRRRAGTTSARNLAHARQLIEAGLMTPAGRAALLLD